MAPDVGLREYRRACNPRAPVAMYPADELAAAVRQIGGGASPSAPFRQSRWQPVIAVISSSGM